MSHEVETMAYAGEKPWHGLGTEVPNDLTSDQMLKKAGLDWQVVKVPLFANYNGKEIPTGQEALIRDSDDSILTVVSSDWNPVQNKDAFDFFHEFIMEGHMNMETAGSLKKGKRVWALAKINKGFTILANDRVESYLLFSNPHEYGKGIDIRVTFVRVVCWNTISMALNTKADTVFRMNHRKVFDPEMVKKTLGMAQDNMTDYKDTAEFLSSKNFSTAAAKSFITKLFPSTSEDEEKISKPAKKVFEVLENQPGVEFGRGSFWQLVNAVTYAVDHKLGRSADTRLQSAWYGNGAQKKIEALKLATMMATAG